MFSTLFELAGFAAITEGVDRLAGPGWAWVAGGILLVVLGVGTNDNAIRASIFRVVMKIMRIRIRRGKAPARPDSPHPPLVIDEVDAAYGEWAAESAERRAAGVY